jgi:hypothetical protein
VTESGGVRLLVCATCKTIEELPWFEGIQEDDDIGNHRMSFHRFPSGSPHFTDVVDLAGLS